MHLGSDDQNCIEDSLDGGFNLKKKKPLIPTNCDYHNKNQTHVMSGLIQEQNLSLFGSTPSTSTGSKELRGK